MYLQFDDEDVGELEIVADDEVDDELDDYVMQKTITLMGIPLYLQLLDIVLGLLNFEILLWFDDECEELILWGAMGIDEELDFLEVVDEGVDILAPILQHLGVELPETQRDIEYEITGVRQPPVMVEDDDDGIIMRVVATIVI